MFGYSDVKFTVIGSNSDTEPPVVESLTVDKTEVTVGDTVTFTLIASDESGIREKNNEPRLAVAKPTSGNSWISIYLKRTEENTYVGSYTISETDINGEYYADQLYLYDTLGNQAEIFGYSDVCFTVMPKELLENTKDISVLEGITVINSNKTLTGSTIFGDLYIAPNSIATLRNVTVTGNIYVLGTMRANSITADQIYVKNLIIGQIAYGNGAANISGTNYINGITASNRVISEVPLRIDSDLIAVDDVLSVKGAFANIATMYIEGQAVNYTNSGKFYLNDIDVSNTDSITVQFVTAEGETFTKVFDIKKGTLDSNGNVDVIPILSASDITVCKGEVLNLLANVSASDFEDGDLTGSIVAEPSAISTNTVGNYNVTYTVTDSNGIVASKTIIVTVKEHNWDSGYITTGATCIAEGEMLFTCVDCGRTRTEVIPAKGHVWSEEYTVDKEATCTEEGSKSIHCSVCGAIDEATVTVIPMTEHIWDDGTVTTQPTYTETGIMTYTCTACRETRTEEIPMLVRSGWQKENSKWYYYQNGSAATGWQKLSGKWYYFDASGIMQTGWVKLSGKWYYFNSSGAMQTGWQKISGKQYFFKPTGAMAANEWVKGYYWINKDGTWTYKYKASWKKSGSKWWFGDTSGWYAKNTTITIDGKKYTFDKSGYMV